MKFARAVDQVISKHLEELRKPGVLSVRPGYQSAGGWLTRKPAIVVTVDRKRVDLAPADRLPETLGGYPVDVREASPLHRLRAESAALHVAAAAAAREEFERPTFPYERDLTDAGQDLAAVAAEVAAARKPPKPEVPYSAPDDVALDEVPGPVRITCHASPDAGWTTLKSFLEGTNDRLTVGMYDITSAHILDAVREAVAGHRTLRLVLDHPAPNPTSDQTDEQTQAALAEALRGRLEFAWALERNNPKANAWSFPNAYHIKVAVRDGTALWLSSGNWNNSNQPDVDPLTDPAGAAPVVRRSDRDWHAIVEHEGLAKVFEAYLRHDYDVAAAHQAAGAESSAAAVAGGAALGEFALEDLALSVPQRVPIKYFAPLPVTARKVQPLLTPDNYARHVLPLILSAKETLYMQTQYIHPSADPTLSALILAVAKKIREGLDVRLIMSQWETTDYLEQVQDAGIDLSCVKIQSGVHNKGIVIDPKRKGEGVVVVSSQNWSGDGVARNRDAGLIIYSDEAAQYWQKIFVHDWVNMAFQQAHD